jgi:hypothetical protein
VTLIAREETFFRRKAEQVLSLGKKNKYHSLGKQNKASFSRKAEQVSFFRKTEQVSFFRNAEQVSFFSNPGAVCRSLGYFCLRGIAGSLTIFQHVYEEISAGVLAIPL